MSLQHALETAGLRPGERFEVAAKPAFGGMQALWSTFDPDGLQRAERWLRRHAQADLYLLGNPIAADAKARRGGRARDVDCAPWRTLLLDVDPEKDKATDPQGTRPDKLEASHAIALDLRAFLLERFGVLVPLVSSGRGRQLWAQIDGELEKDARKRLVRGLGKRFDRPELASVDRATYNPARLMRLPGGINSRTGWRAEVLDQGDGKAIPADLLRQLADELEPKPVRVAGRGAAPAAGGKGTPGKQTEFTRLVLDAAPVARALDLLGLDPPAPGGRIACPIHGGENPNFSIERAGWRCWSKCDTSGSSIDLVAGVRGLGYLAARDWLAQRVGVERPKPAERTLPLLDVSMPPHAPASPAEVAGKVRGVLRWSGKRSDSPPVLQDVSPTGTGKTTRAARELVDASAEGGQAFAWASPSHDHARSEVLPALAEAGAAIWDMDLDGGEGGGVRARLERLGAEILPLGQRAGARPVACKLEPFYCPGPAVPGWTSGDVEQLYQAAAAAGWNPAASVCRACPKFLTGADSGLREPCAYWAGRREAAGADLLVIAHHSMREGSSSTAGRGALVIDEDPKGALVQVREATSKSCRSFEHLVEAAADLIASDAGRTRELLEVVRCEIEQEGPTVDRTLRRNELAEELEGLEEAAEVVREQADQVLEALRAVRALHDELAAMHVAPPAAELEVPEGVDPEALQATVELGKACERKLRDLAKAGKQLTGPEGLPAGKARNLLPLAAELGKAWEAGSAAVLHCQRRFRREDQSHQLEALTLPTVRQLPKLPTLALDATGTPRLLELATGRAVETVEGAFSGGLEGVHLADVPVSRRRWRREAGSKSGGRSGPEALAADIRVVLRHARRTGARSVGLVTFLFAVPTWVERLEAEGLEVHTLHYGDEVGSNAFAAADVDLVAVVGTPFVPPEVVRLWAALEGAGLPELLEDGTTWEHRRLPGGGMARVQVFSGEATQRAYTAIVRARLEQALGRALRWDWKPRCGVLVMAEPWPTRHRLRLSTRELEGLDGPLADAAEALGCRPEEVTPGVSALVAMVGGTSAAASCSGTTHRAVRLWCSGTKTPSISVIRGLIAACSGTADLFRRNKPGQNFTGFKCLDCGTFTLYILSLGVGSATWRKGSQMADLVSRAFDAAGGSCQALAAAVGYSERAVRLWREGARSPGPKATNALRAYLEAFEANRGELVSSQGQASDEQPAVARVVLRGAGNRRRARAVLVELLETSPEDAGHVLDHAPTVLLPLPYGKAVELVEGLAAAGADVGLELMPGAKLPSGQTYAPAVADAQDVPPAPPPVPDKRTEVGMGLAELRNWLTQPLQRPPRWLREAAAEARGLNGFCRRIGRRQVEGQPTVDLDLALERAQAQACDVGAPIYVRRLWGHAVQHLRGKGAKPRGVKALTGARGRRARSGGARCVACGDTGRSSTGKPCTPCEQRRQLAKHPLVSAAKAVLR